VRFVVGHVKPVLCGKCGKTSKPFAKRDDADPHPITSGSAMAAVEHALRHGATITGLEKDESADEGG
jgi:hypothetical protein